MKQAMTCKGWRRIGRNKRTDMLGDDLRNCVRRNSRVTNCVAWSRARRVMKQLLPLGRSCGFWKTA
jgi:hypothetical protein